jgi:hypothetical protein
MENSEENSEKKRKIQKKPKLNIEKKENMEEIVK